MDLRKALEKLQSDLELVVNRLVNKYYESSEEITKDCLRIIEFKAIIKKIKDKIK